MDPRRGIREHGGGCEVLAESLEALAAAGGAAVVQAATTDAWTEVRARVARWFGRGDGERERVQLERLDRTAAELVAAGGTEQEQNLQAQVWRSRFEDLLEGLDEAGRNDAAAGLRALLDDTAAARAVSAGTGGVAAGRDVTVKAEGGSIAAAVLHGGAHIGPPPVPDPSQG
ncbi:hypothetical protein [Streptomyces sp. NBC_00347]|uniref:hypothetical protein n=1 Tax=Streptomyces sp. NBC_00347 TaxID=2975721 RepID=UPI002254DD5D|nr:hypothetical protein [Streptomyces sp. NBC_00347]MCX5123283.1 hypothetical protein [Streptomyces sp. NBC_00347]